MSFTWLIVIHWLHILAGIVWCGGQIFMAAAVWPALMRRPAPEAKAMLETIGAPVGLLLGAAEALVLGLGIVHGTWLGPIRSLDALFGSRYGQNFLMAFTATVLLIAYGWFTRRQLPEKVWNGDQFQPGAVSYLRRINIVSIVGLGVITSIMARWHFGL